MKSPFHVQIRFMRFFRSGVTRFTRQNSVRHNLCAPFTLVRAHTKQTNFIRFSGFTHVLQVTEPRYLTQIAKTIVHFVAVYMVNMLRRPFTRNVSPRQSVRQLLAVMDSYGPITRRMFRPRRSPDQIRSPTVCCPYKYACISVVVERIAQIFYGARVIRSHDVVFTIGAAQ